MKKLIFSFYLLLAAGSLFAQQGIEKLEEVMQAYIANNRFNGVVLVHQQGKLSYQKGFGFRDAAAKTPHDPESVFQIGSVTKQFTAALIMQLVEEKKISLQDRLSKFFPGFKNGDKITIEHLLTHQSGIFNYTEDSLLMSRDVTQHYTMDQMVEIFKNYPPVFEPGAKFDYSNSGYSLLGYIIEKVSRKPYEQVMRERIFRPLGMNNTGFDFTRLPDTKKAKGYFYLGKDTMVKAPIVDSTIAHAAGAMYSTVADLLKWERAISEGKILKAESWKKVFTPQKENYGYGWGIDTVKGRIVHSHSGGIHGFTSYIMRYPEQQLTVVLLDNSSARLGGIARNLAAAALGDSTKLPEVKNQVKVSTAKLKDFTGEYELAPGFSIAIMLEGNQLKAQATAQPAFEIYPEKENLFFLKVVDAKIEFLRNDKGDVIAMILYQNGMELRGEKIK